MKVPSAAQGRGSMQGQSDRMESSSDHTVQGERALPCVGHTQSLQSRLSSLLACGLMVVLGGGMLTWYYSHALSRQSKARRDALSGPVGHAQSESRLPALGRVALLGGGASGVQPVDAAEASKGHPRPGNTDTTADSRIPPAALGESVLGQAPLGQGATPWSPGATTYSAAQMGGTLAYGGAVALPPRQTAAERRLSGTVFASSAQISPATQGASPLTSESAQLASNSTPPASLQALLKPSAATSSPAQVLPTKRLWLPKGAFIDCTLETAIDSTLPGMTACITATDTFGVDGTVVLLERGTKLIGETRGQVQQGAARVFVLWTQARTPAGVIVPLESPGADELGRSGLAGEVDHHFWERFGAAILVSTLDGAVQAASQSATHGNGAVIYSPSASTGILTEVLKSTVNIPPTIRKQNGDRIQVLVARDLDFRSVYELRSAANSR